MPTYQYACPDCGLEFEKVQKFTDDAIKKCPKCGKRHVYRVVSKVAVTFKGSGWYITDSKKGNTLSDTKDAKDTKEAKDTKDTKPEKSDEVATSEAPKAEPAKEAPAAESKPEKKAAAKKKSE